MSERNRTTVFLKGVSVTGFFTVVGGIVGLVYFSLMSRLLSKADFGYFAALTGVLAIVTGLANAGLGAAIIQKKDASSSYVSTAFSLSILIGILFNIIIFLLAPFLANLIADDTLTTPLRIMSLTLFFQSLVSVANAILYRQLKFARIGFIGFIANIITTVISVIMAFMGFGLYAMILYSTLQPMLAAMILFSTSVKVPSLHIYKEHVGNIFSFGGWLTLSVICNDVAKQIDKILLPKLASVEVLGAYSRPAHFVSNISGQITDVMDKVLFPMLSDIQNERERAREVLYRSLELLNCISVVLACLFFFNARFIIYLFFGEDWFDLIPIFRISSITVIFLIDNQLVDCFFRSLNYVRTSFIIRFFSMFWFISCVIVGSLYGIIGIAVSLAFANISLIIIKMLILGYKIKASALLICRKFMLAWKSAIIPMSLGFLYINLQPNNIILYDIIFAFLFALIIAIEYLFFPQFVGNEYKESWYPYFKRFLDKIYNK